MLKDLLTTLTKLDLAKLDARDVERIAGELRDSALFDTQALSRQGQALARRTRGYVAANPRRAGMGLGGAALLGLGAFAAYRFLSAKQPETMLDVTDMNADKPAKRPSVTTATSDS